MYGSCCTHGIGINMVPVPVLIRYGGAFPNQLSQNLFEKEVVKQLASIINHHTGK
jgi:hypothetical protein